MFENDVFDTWLDAKSKEIILKLDQEKLTSEEMIILMLKAQTNHFAHLDVDLRQEMTELNRDLRQEMMDLNRDLRQEMIDLRKDMDKRFEQVDKRFEQVDKRFEQVDKRFEALTSRIDRFMIWSFATTLAIGAGIVAAIRYLPAVS
jgi:predicted  nucleic acid-binding Zn-ribbon protein